MIIVELPWPHKDLSPNARVHFMALSRAKKKYRRDCMYAVMAVNATASGPQELGFMFHPPHNRRYDKDNLIASMKAGIDGIADALKIDDSNFHIGPPEIGAIAPGGKVRVFIKAMEEA